MLIRRRGARRRSPVALIIALVILLGLATSYGIGLTQDTVEVEDHGGPGIARGTLAVCGGRQVVELHRSLVQHSAWRATPRRLCAGEATVTMTMADGTVSSCTGFGLHPGSDWRVVLTDSGCHGFEPATLPALP